MVLPAGANGKTRLLALRPEALDFETRVAHDVCVRATNGAGLYHDASVALRPEALDFETRVAHDVCVRATNGAGLYHDASVCIALTNVSRRKAADRRKAVGQHCDGQ
jgi:hypothetical protein